jgi:hypothetical protein
MRRSIVALLVLLALTGGAATVWRSDDLQPQGSLLLLGDSLNVGIEPYLPDALPGWTIVVDDRVGRTTAEGVRVLGAVEPAPVVVVSLGTNDPPEDVDGFRAGVRGVLGRVGRERCVVWATIVRDGIRTEGLNGVLRQAARVNADLRLVEWDLMVREMPSLLAADGVHGTRDGYTRRAAAVAAAVRDCDSRTR